MGAKPPLDQWNLLISEGFPEVENIQKYVKNKKVHPASRNICRHILISHFNFVKISGSDSSTLLFEIHSPRKQNKIANSQNLHIKPGPLIYHT